MRLDELRGVQSAGPIKQMVANVGRKFRSKDHQQAAHILRSVANDMLKRWVIYSKNMTGKDMQATPENVLDFVTAIYGARNPQSRSTGFAIKAMNEAGVNTKELEAKFIKDSKPEAQNGGQPRVKRGDIAADALAKLLKMPQPNRRKAVKIINYIITHGRSKPKMAKQLQYLSRAPEFAQKYPDLAKSLGENPTKMLEAIEAMMIIGQILHEASVAGGHEQILTEWQAILEEAERLDEIGAALNAVGRAARTVGQAGAKAGKAMASAAASANNVVGNAFDKMSGHKYSKSVLSKQQLLWIFLKLSEYLLRDGIVTFNDQGNDYGAHTKGSIHSDQHTGFYNEKKFDGKAAQTSLRRMGVRGIDNATLEKFIATLKDARGDADRVKRSLSQTGLDGHEGIKKLLNDPVKLGMFMAEIS